MYHAVELFESIEELIQLKAIIELVLSRKRFVGDSVVISHSDYEALCKVLYAVSKTEQVCIVSTGFNKDAWKISDFENSIIARLGLGDPETEDDYIDKIEFTISRFEEKVVCYYCSIDAACVCGERRYKLFIEPRK